MVMAGRLNYVYAAVAAAAVLGLLVTAQEPPKAPPAEPVAAPAAVGPSVTKALATGALAAFVVKPQRQPVPDIAFSDGAGAPLTLGRWRGRVALVNLWATWCAPCRKEMPDLAKLQQELGSKDFEVVAISIDRKGAEASGAFLAETQATALKLYVDPSSDSLGKLQAIGLPATVLIDRQGREIGRLLGPADWASPEALALIRAALAEPAEG